ncbi:MAG: hypothetical protein GY861_18120 [bacterium]|nr:hypothetical protein [bacterium]
MAKRCFDCRAYTNCNRVKLLKEQMKKKAVSDKDFIHRLMTMDEQYHCFIQKNGFDKRKEEEDDRGNDM